MTTYQIRMPYFTCGVSVEANIVTDAAPIMRWAVGKNWVYVADWVTKKGGDYEEVPVEGEAA